MQNLMVVFAIFVLDWKYPFLVNLLQSNQNYLFKVKFGPRLLEYAEFKSNVYFFCFILEIPFLGKFGRENQSYQFKLKFGT